MRIILPITLSLIFIIVIVFSSCDKSSDKVTNNAPAENLLCGDANGDGTLNLLDITGMAAYIYGGNSLKDTIASEVDNIRGITLNDVIYLWAYLYRFANDPKCSSHIPDTILPVSADTIFVSNLVVPAGEDKWSVDITLKADSNLYAICFPYHYDCPGGNIACDSIVYNPAKGFSGAAGKGIPSDILGHPLIDSTAQIGLLLTSRIGEGFPADSISLASIWFSLTPSEESQMITIDTTTYPPSNYLIMSRYEAPATIASVPVIVYE